MADQPQNAHASTVARGSGLPGASADNHACPDVDVDMLCELSQQRENGPFQAVLIREATRHWEDDPEPDGVEKIVCEVELDAAPTDVFDAVDRWLLAGHRLRVQPATWTPGDTGPGTGVVVLMAARAVPATPVSACA